MDYLPKFTAACRDLDHTRILVFADNQIKSVQQDGSRAPIAPGLALMIARAALAQSEQAMLNEPELVIRGLQHCHETATRQRRLTQRRIFSKTDFHKTDLLNLKLAITCLEGERSALLAEVLFITSRPGLRQHDPALLHVLARKASEARIDAPLIHMLYRALASHCPSAEERQALLAEAATTTDCSQRLAGALHQLSDDTAASHIDRINSNLVKNGRVALGRAAPDRGYEINFQLTPWGLQALREGLRSLPPEDVHETEFTYTDAAGKIKASAGKAIDVRFPGRGLVTVAIDPFIRALEGQVRVELEPGLDPEAALAAAHRMLTLMGLGGTLCEQDRYSFERTRMMALFQILHPNKVARLKHKRPDLWLLSPSVLRQEMLALVPSLKNTFDQHLNRMYLQNVRPGQSEWAYRGMAQRMRAAGAVGLISGVGSVHAVISMLMGGAKATHERYSEHVIREGLSSDIDLQMGGGRYVFTRVCTKQLIGFNHRDAFPLAGSIAIGISLEVAERVCFMYGQDSYGATGTKQHANRKPPHEVTRGLGRHGTLNELMIKGCIPAYHMCFVSVRDKAVKQRLVLALEEAGLIKDGCVMGIPLKKFIRVGTHFRARHWDHRQWAPATPSPELGKQF